MEKDKEIYDIQCSIEEAFSKLIGSLSVMEAMDSYKEDKSNIRIILDEIINWNVEFYKEKNLCFINTDELLKVYYELDKLKEKYLFKDDLGDESELSDEAVIWMLELMKLRKNLIEMEK